MVFVHAAVGQHADIRPVAVGLVHFHIEPLDGARDAGALIISDGHFRHLEPRCPHMLDFQHVGIGQDGVVDFEHLAIFRPRAQEVAVLPHIDRRGRDNLLADGVDGRVGHLRKQLLKIVEQRLRLIREHGERRVHAHGRDPLRAVSCHAADRCAVFLIRIPERLLQAGALPRGIGRHCDIRDL